VATGTSKAKKVFFHVQFNFENLFVDIEEIKAALRVTVIRRAHFTMRPIAIKKQVIAFVQRIEEAGFATNVQMGIGEHRLNAKVILCFNNKFTFLFSKLQKNLSIRV
jgi:hypothetical protein